MSSRTPDPLLTVRSAVVVVLAFVVGLIDRKSDRTAIIKTFALNLHKSDGTQADPYLYWNEFGQLTWVPSNGLFDYQRCGIRSRSGGSRIGR